MKQNTAVFPGSFDPITNGHLDLVERSLKICDTLIVAIANNPSKTPLFSLEERLDILSRLFSDRAQIQVDSFDGLLVDYVKSKEIQLIIRGLRVASDFEYEFQMANMNRKLYDNVETAFMMTGQDHFYISSRFVKEAARFGGDISSLVPPIVGKMLRQKFDFE